MSLPRRQKALLGLLVILLLAGVGYRGYRWRFDQKRAAHWEAMLNRQAEFARLNGLPGEFDNQQAEQAARAPVAKTVAGPAALVEPVHLLWKESDWEGRLLLNIDGCLPIDSGKDVVWSGTDLFLLSEPGRIDRIWSVASIGPTGFATPLNRSMGRPCFDGRYVWLFVGGYGPQIVVIDPEARQGWEFGNQATGLFPENVNNPRSIQVGLAAVRPGVVCAVIVTKDALLAMLHFDPEGKHEVEVIELPKGVTLGRTLQELFTLEATVDGKRMRRIIVGRELLPPLLLDPETHETSLGAANSSQPAYRTGHWCVDEGAVWWQKKSARGDEETTLMRATLPDLKEEAVLAKIPSALLAPFEGGLALVGKGCWQWKKKGQELASLEADVFWAFRDDLYAPDHGMQAPPGPVAPETAPRFDDLFRAGPDMGPGARTGTYQSARVFASNVYGLLLNGTPRAAGRPQVFRIATADAADNASEPGAGRLPPAPTTTSRFLLAKASGDAADQTRPVAAIEAAVEPVHLRQGDWLPVLARELVRQSLWLAARSELGCAVADGAVGESFPTPPTAREFQLSSSFRADGLAEISLESVEPADDSRTNWRQELRLLNHDGMFDYALLVEKAEAWSREEFPTHLTSNGEHPTSGAAQPETGAAQPETSAETESALSEMTFPAQFAAVRNCSQAADGALGGLVRGYANLGLLTEHHWNMVHKVFQARALLYAQRMVAKQPRSPNAFWHRAYAEALAGLPNAALDDLAKADELANGQDGEEVSGGRPGWVDVVAAACNNGGDTLAKYSDDPQVGQLAGLLRFLQLSRLPFSVLAMQAAGDLVKRQPECFRAYDAMCDCCELDEVRKSTRAALAALRQRFPARLRQMAGLPASVLQQLDLQQLGSPSDASASDGSTEATGEGSAGQGATTGRLAIALLEATDHDPCDLSWQALGSLLSETLFLQTWRRAHFLRFEVGEDPEKFLATAAPRVAHHRCGRLLDFYYVDKDRFFAGSAELDGRRKSAATELLRRLDLGTLSEVQQRLYDYYFGEAWQVQRPEQYAAALSRNFAHCDSVMGDLLEQLYEGKRARLLPAEYFEEGDAHEMVRQLHVLDPGNPEVMARAVRHNFGLAARLFEELVAKYPKEPYVLRELIDTLGGRGGGPRQLLHDYVQVSPDGWAYKRLARSYLDEGKTEQWQTVLDEYLSHQPDNEQAAQTRLEMANVFLSRAEWEKALPYAEAAAAKKSEGAMAALIRCYQGLGDDEQEGVWHERIVDRYPTGDNARERYLWSRRTGLGDAKSLANEASMRIGAGNPFAPAGSQARNATFCWLAGRPAEALAWYQSAAESSDNPRQPAVYHLCMALIAHETGDQTARDDALAQVSALRGQEVELYRRAAALLAKGFSSKKIDSEEAEEIAASAPILDKGAVNFLFGYAMLLVGQTREAVPFLGTAATFREGAGSMSRTLASAALRDRGLVPGKINKNPE